jgi:uncharacterized membrane protein YkvA (DUF1232 family)
MKVTFELSDEDLRHFRALIKQARSAAKTIPEEEIISGARERLSRVEKAELPQFVRERLVKLRPMIEMLEDEEWRLGGADRERVVSALAYFREPEDLIPDDVPGFGFLDDAIMVQLLLEDLRLEISAFEEFCAYREAEQERRGTESDVTRKQWIEAKREALHRHMSRRRRVHRHQRRGRRSSRSPFSLW